MSNLEEQVKKLAAQQKGINEQLEKLATAMTSIAVMEERSKSMNDTLNGFGKRLNEMEILPTYCRLRLFFDEYIVYHVQALTFS